MPHCSVLLVADPQTHTYMADRVAPSQGSCDWLHRPWSTRRSRQVLPTQLGGSKPGWVRFGQKAKLGVGATE